MSQVDKYSIVFMYRPLLHELTDSITHRIIQNRTQYTVELAILLELERGTQNEKQLVCSG